MYQQQGNGVGLPGQAPPSPGTGPAPAHVAPTLQASFRGATKRPKLGSLAVTCPMVVGAMGGYVPLPVTRMAFNAQAHISVGFVNLTMDVYYPQTWQAAPLQLYLPKTTSTVISEVVVENLVRDQMFVTAIVPAEDAQKGGYRPSVAYDPSGQPLADPTASNDPELFVLPMPGRATPGDQYRIRLSYFAPLDFEEGSYLLRLPTELPMGMVPQGYHHSQILDVTVTLNTGSPTPVQYAVRSGHSVAPGGEGPGTATLSVKKEMQVPNTDVEVGYRVWGNDMFIALNVSPPSQPSPATPDPRGAFVLTVAPPAPEFTQPFPRSIIFILDRSGSMAGEPMHFAKSALLFGLRSLTPLDTFTVVAFDHEQLWFTPGGQLLPASQDNVAACEAWVRGSVEARGMTDIMAPLTTAMDVLLRRPPTHPPSLPFIFLVTDGCVQNEKDICRHVEQHVRSLLAAPPTAVADGQPPTAPTAASGIPRICTFGIGPYCNHYFLKQLATYGRGAFDVAFRAHAIQAQMQAMLTAAQRPVLSDVTLTLPGVKGCELYPYPLPDLFCGMPLVIAGKYDGSWPANGITVNGTLPNGTMWSSNPVLPSPHGPGLPLDQVFIKSRLDLLTAQAWLQGDPPALINNIVNLSIATGVPCAHTRTVGFETTKAQYDKMQQVSQQQGRRKVNYAAYAVGGVAGIAVLAGLGVGAAFLFGDLGATAANAGVGDALGGGLAGVGDIGGGGDCCGGDCGDCGGCDGSGGDCGGCDPGSCDIGSAGCAIM